MVVVAPVVVVAARRSVVAAAGCVRIGAVVRVRLMTRILVVVVVAAVVCGVLGAARTVIVGSMVMHGTRATTTSVMMWATAAAATVGTTASATPGVRGAAGGRVVGVFLEEFLDFSVSGNGCMGAVLDVLAGRGFFLDGDAGHVGLFRVDTRALVLGLEHAHLSKAVVLSVVCFACFAVDLERGHLVGKCGLLGEVLLKG